MLRSLSLIAALLLTSACDEAQIIMDRPDSGSAVVDAGISGPLPLEAGMVFTYQGRLTARAPSLGDEKTALYELVVTIESVDDQGLNGRSRLTYSATGQNVLNQDWTDPYDFSSWVARLGPALRGDVVSGQTIDVDLSAVPSLPERRNPKELPAGSLFIDTRKIVDLRARFAEVYADARPRVVDPGSNQGTWLFEHDGTDPTIITYEVPRRKVRIEYDPRGFVTRIQEELGESGTEPTGVNVLTLENGP